MKTQRSDPFRPGLSYLIATLSLPFLLLLSHCGAPPSDEFAEDPGPPPPAVEELPEAPARELPAPTLPSGEPTGEPSTLEPQPLDPALDPALGPDPDFPPAPKGRLKTRGIRPAAPATGEEPESKEFHTVEVHYGTNRAPTAVTTHNDRYGAGRHLEGPMEYGKTLVSIPLHHRIGVVERPRWYRLEFSEDPKRHVVIVELEKLAADDFFASVDRSVASREKSEALLFIHGFNVDFDSAVRRTAQIAFDLDFGGVALAFSWPSQASLGAYTVDAANAEWSIPHLANFLLDIQEKTEIERIHVIAHSMGTRVLSNALAHAAREGFDLKLSNVILAAPDIDADVFHDQLLPRIAEMTQSLTMYASSDDTALKVSQRIHGNARLGLSSPQLRVFAGMDTINASGIDTSMLGHGYYGSHKVVVRDLFNLITRGLDPARRELVPGDSGEWGFGEIGLEP